jgi:electron transfer flavoprotein alpha subunit
LVHGSDASVKS